MNIIDTVTNYINTRVRLTRCKQKHFKQLCHRCKEYPKCKLYADSVDAWIKLQEVVK